MKCLNVKSPLVKEYLKVAPRQAVLMNILDEIEKEGLPMPSPEEMERMYQDRLSVVQSEIQMPDYDKDVQQDIEKLQQTIGRRLYTPEVAQAERLDLEKRFPRIAFTVKNSSIPNKFKIEIASKQTDKGELGKLYSFLKSKIPGIKIQKINASQAKELSGRADARAFIKGDTIYFVEGKVHDLILMEEFFHPFIEAIYQKNKPTFDSLLQEAKEIYPNLWTATKTFFPRLSEQDQEKEMLTKALSRAFKKEYEENAPISLNNLRFRIKRLIDKFLDWMSDYFTNGKLRAEDIKIGTTLRELAILINVNNNTLDAAFTNNIMFNAPPGPNTQTKKDTIVSELKNLSSKIARAPDDKSYISMGETYSRLTEWVKEKIAKKSKTTQSFAEDQADRYFKSHVNEEINGVPYVVYGESGKVTRQQLIDIKTKEFNTSTALGKVIHGLIEATFKAADGGDTTKLLDDVNKYAQAKADQDPIDVAAIKDWLDKTINRTMADLGITTLNDKIKSSLRDIILTENYLKSDILKVATTADGTIVHPDGGISIIDWKTGKKFLDSSNYGTLLNDIAEYSNNVTDSRVDLAKLEVVFRALMIKEQIPTAHFKMLKIAHLSKWKNTYLDINLQDYLTVIDHYFLNNDTAIHEQLKSKGLLDAFNYGTAETLTEDIESGTRLTEIEKIDEKLIALRNEIINTPSKTHKLTLEKEMVTLAKRRMELEFNVSPELASDTEDIGAIKALFGNYYSVGNKIVQMVGRIFFKAKQVFNERKSKLEREFNLIQKELFDEWKKKHGAGFNATKVPYFNKQGTGLYNFFWVKKTRGGVEGYYKVSPSDPEWNSLTAIQKKYITFMQEKMQETYTKNVGMKVDKRGTTYAQFLGLENELDASFVPRVPMLKAEYLEQFGIKDPRVIKSRMDTVRKIFNKNSYRGEEPAAIPIKYLENATMIGERTHSFNPELAFKMFMENMMFREEMDPVLSLGKASLLLLRANPKNLKNTEDFLANRIAMDILHQKAETKYVKKDITILGRRFNVDASLDAIRKFVSSSTMILKPVSGIRNALLISYLNWKKAGVGSIAKATGVPEDQIDFTTSDMAHAYSIVLRDRFASAFRKDGGFLKTKLGLLLKELDYRQDNMDYYNSRESLISAKWKELNLGGIGIPNPINSGSLYFFHKIGEDLGTDTLLVAQLLRMKNHKTGKSVWDSYEINDGELEWTGGTRGVSVSGEVITGLTSDEITKLKRTSQMIHGSYRDEEKMAIEMYALGRWAIMFKKYLPVLIENLGQSYYNDPTIGRYEVQRLQGLQGKDLLVWKSDINEGRIWTFTKMMAAVLKLKNGNAAYSPKNLTGKQRQDMIDLGVTFGLFAILATAALMYFDDDDEDTWTYMMAWRTINDMTQGLNPVDVYGAVKSPLIAHVKFVNIASAYMEFLYDGVIKGEKTNKGYLKGQINAYKVTPFLSWRYELERLYQDGIIESSFMRDR